MTKRRWLAVPGALLVSACASPVAADLPPRLIGMPWSENEVDQATLRARHLHDRGRFQDALELLDDVLVAEPQNIEAHRVRQDILRQRGRMGLLLHESEMRLRADPRDPMALYLHGRLAPGNEHKREFFELAAQEAPDSFWPWLGLAFAYRTLDPEKAIEIYSELYEASGRHPLAAVAFASALRAEGRSELAVEVYRDLRASEALPGVGDLGIAETLMALERRREAWPAFLSALETRPFDPGVRRLMREFLAQGLPDQQVEQFLDVLRQDPDVLEAFGRDDGADLLVNVFVRTMQPHAARRLLEAGEPEGPRSAVARRVWRRLMLATGDARAFLRSLAADYPAALLEDETNRLRGLWVTLLRGAWTEAEEPLGSFDDAKGLVDALVRAGLLEEAEILADLAFLRHRDHPRSGEIGTLRDEARRELAFEGALRRVLYHGYSSPEPPSLDDTLAELRRVSREILGRDVVGDPPRFQVPMIGTLLDPFAPDSLGTHLARYNRHLVLGQRSGGPVEGIVLTRLSLREVPKVPELALEARCMEVVGEDRAVRSYSGIYGGDLAGVALLNHYLVDFDAVREWARSILERREVAEEDGFALMEDPLPEDLRPLDPMDVHWRLSVVSPVEDTDLLAAVLDMIRWHEHAHLVDSYYFLPIEQNLFRALGLLFQHGFSAMAIEGEMERRAELAALAMSPHTRLVLAHIADFLNTPESLSPHALGFRSLARQLSSALESQGIPARDCHPSRWHLLDAGRVQAAARGLLGQAW